MVFDFVTWNIRTLYKVGAQLSVISEIEKYKMSVTAIQETRVLGREINEVKKFMVLNSGKTEGKHEYGVAFIVHPSFKGNIIDFKPINERICVLRVRMKFFNVAMINVYATTEDKGPQEKDEFYYQLERVLDTLHANDVKIVLGDLNAKIGGEEEFRNTIGRNSLHEISNDNGRRLIDFAESKNLIISSTQFAHKDIHKQTWRSPDVITTNQIDHVLIDKRRASGIQDVRSYRGADTDHYLVKARYLCKINRKSKSKYQPPRRINVNALKEQEIRNNKERI
ncbi:hypothetical protein C0J52_21184 [Blattella germanica]|nr:hypothetical protein C0J52_21184 [Blattella germanica]